MLNLGIRGLESVLRELQLRVCLSKFLEQVLELLIECQLIHHNPLNLNLLLDSLHLDSLDLSMSRIKLYLQGILLDLGAGVYRLTLLKETREDFHGSSFLHFPHFFVVFLLDAPHHSLRADGLLRLKSFELKRGLLLHARV